MRYRILGPTQALRDDGTPVAVGGARLRALLTALALRPGRTVPAGALTDEVWAADPPADATGALQALVGRLRRALGHGAITSVDGGYRLCAGPEDVDLYCFERLAGEGERALDAGDPAEAAALLDEALSLWTGQALADLPDRTGEATRWETRRLAVRRTRLASALALGRAEEALPELAALCDDHPIDEQLQALRLRALRDAGRTAQALAAYEDLRQDLATRLGTAPSPQLRALHAELLSPTPPHVLEASVTAARPGAWGLGPPRGGSRKMSQPGRGGAGEESAAPGAAQAHGAQQRTPPPTDPRTAPQTQTQTSRGNLRSRLTSFVGREADIDVIRGDLAGARLVTLLGPGGAGKTRLSQEAAEAADGAWRDGVWLAELAPVDDPATVPEAVLVALGARETVLRGAGAEELRAADRHGNDPLVRLVEHCARRQMLLLLDNCEHVIDAAAHLAEELLVRCPGVTVLATSREPLGVPGEVVRPVEPLPDPMALRLLAERGAAAKPGFRTDDDPAAAAEICRRLDGLPLAIELAAARLRMLTPRQIADRLDDRFRLLTGGSRTVLPRQQTLRAVVDWSWDLLDEPERAALRALSVFAGGCDLPAAEAVCGPDALDVLGSLVDKSLVVASPSGEGGGEGHGASEGAGGSSGGMRYRLLETVAEYAAERLDESGERDATEHRHLVHFRELARHADPLLRGREQLTGISRLQVEYENLRTALRRAIAARDEHEALCLVHSLAWYWQIRDLRSEARHWSLAAAELGPDPFAPPAAPAPALHERCTDTPPPMAPEQLLEARRGAWMIHLASMNHDLDEWTSGDAMAWLRRVVDVYRPGLPQTCRTPGTLWFYAIMLTGSPGQLNEVIDRTVDTCRELGYVWELAAALQMRANILANRSAWAGDAGRDADESLEIFTRLGDAWGAAEALSARGEARERTGKFALAAEDFRAAIAHAGQLGAKEQVALLRVRLAGVMVETGDGEEAEAMLRAVLAEVEHSGHECEPAARIYLAVWLARSGRRDEGREQLECVRRDFKKSTLAIFEGFVLGLLSWLDNLDGRYAAALDKARQALERSCVPLSRMVAPHMPAIQLMIAARALAGLGGPGMARDAARLLHAHDALLPPGHFVTTQERETRADAEAAARAALGDTAYESAYAEGSGLTLDEAAALAAGR
ncbi:AfsR/SARP family transcriptional regulator [Streptomyces spiramyceticus]|uniref:AfsR/SARP family transcriptional regulator n=1 Tax=Streptomyces spiramyceticus TaxID=299717 RepID=UPI00237B763F|nr:BTAD domain-containing putative transcriptional regulator [Streptomyces spiramyceticus]